MNEPALIKKLRKNDRYFISLLSVFILGLLLLFYRDLDDWMRHFFVPAFTIYIIGTALIAQIQNMLGNRVKLRCKANNNKFVGIEQWKFSIIITAHIGWFFLFLWYLCNSMSKYPFNT